MSPVNVSAIGAYIRDQREQAKISLRQLAQAAGVSNPYLSQIERGLRKPSADILQRIASGLRVSAEALYVQAGLLEDRPAASAVRDAVMSDPELTERQKQMLMEIYESFRKETATARAQATVAETDEDGMVTDPAAYSWPEDVGPEALAPQPEHPANDAKPGQPASGGQRKPADREAGQESGGAAGLESDRGGHPFPGSADAG
jgi:transcriptional regulator with XRE-family HTH domain